MPSLNVLFKKGELSDLFASDGSIKSGISVVNGAIYFAMNKDDSGEERGKLYLGEDNKLIPIGEDVVLKTVSQISALPTASLHKDEFYYCTDGNILAYSNGSSWAQVNSSARLVSDPGNAITVSGSSNTATVGVTIKDRIGNDANSEHTAEGAFTLTGGTNVTLSTSSTAITISAKDTTYDLATATIAQNANGKAGVKLTLTDNNSPANVDTVAIRTSSSVVASLNANGEIEFAVDTSGVGSVTSVTGGNGQREDDGSASAGTASTQGFHMIVGTTTTTHTGNIDPLISVLNASGTVAETVHFVNGTASLNVYTASAVETKITEMLNAVNAMTYRGSATTMSDITGVTGGLHNGDVFLATTNFSTAGYTTEPSGVTVKEGYLIVVHGGTETAGVITNPSGATYTIIKANDTDTTYSVSSIVNGLELLQGSEGVGSLTVSGGTAIDVSGLTGTASQVVTVSHATVTATNYVTTAATQTASYTNNVATISVVTGVTVNTQGHTTGVTITPIEIRNTVLATAETQVTASSNTATIGITMYDSSENPAAAEFSLTSSSLEIATTTTSGQLAVNLVWGSF